MLMQECRTGEAGKKLWADCIEVGVEARKDVLARCSLLKPFIPPVVRGKACRIILQKKFQMI